MLTALLILFVLAGVVLLLSVVVLWYTLGGAGETHDTSRHTGWEERP